MKKNSMYIIGDIKGMIYIYIKYLPIKIREYIIYQSNKDRVLIGIKNSNNSMTEIKYILNLIKEHSLKDICIIETCLDNPSIQNRSITNYNCVDILVSVLNWISDNIYNIFYYKLDINTQDNNKFDKYNIMPSLLNENLLNVKCNMEELSFINFIKL